MKLLFISLLTFNLFTSLPASAKNGEVSCEFKFMLHADLHEVTLNQSLRFQIDSSKAFTLPSSPMIDVSQYTIPVEENILFELQALGEKYLATLKIFDLTQNKLTYQEDIIFYPDGNKQYFQDYDGNHSTTLTRVRFSNSSCVFQLK